MLKRLLKRLFLIGLLGAFLLAGYFAYSLRKNTQAILSYRTQIEAVAEKEGISEHLELIYAIILTESKGKAIDLMQSSESVYGKTEQFETQQESIEAGISFLAQALAYAEEKDCDLWTAVQAYNFGLDYIDFVAKNGGKNTVQLAERYSKEVLSPILGNDSQTTYRYYRLQSILYNGGYLYQNGGNMFYADVVKLNQWLMHWISKTL